MAKDIELAIVFADVVGSTRLYEELGDQRAREVVATCIDIMRQATEEHHGTVIKTMGDEVMSTFAVANDALNADAQDGSGTNNAKAPATSAMAMGKST